MNKHDKLVEGLELKYTGRGFAGFIEENPFVVFLGYDVLGWSNIWVRYNGRYIFTSIFDVELA
ncbi:MAG: hypothetical protein EOP47_25945 [Sphingobacteriaceae bacterium]|nr:MAG: hypothetical protein EOP47_25945 [Sphingobacteriaceae bacterium]